MTISDIAKEAGVSSAAVSRYFNNGYLSDEKKEAIRRVVEETGYRPSIQAQVLRTKKTKMIGVIIPKVDSSSMGRVIAGILKVLDTQGYRMLLADTQNNPKKELEYLSVFEDTQVDGIIIAGTCFSANYRKAIKKLACPVVIVGQELAGFNCIYHDDYNAMCEMTKAMIQHGRRNLGYIGVMEKDRAVGEQRYKGYCDALKSYGMNACSRQYVVGDFTMESGYECMKNLYAQYPDMDGVLCATDRIAIGACKYLRENAPQALEKIAFSGQGDSDMVAVTYPPISTIHYYYEESGKVCAERLLELIGEEEKSIVKEIKLGFEVIERL